DLRKEQAAERARGHLTGIGVSFFTEAVGAGPRKHMDILGIGMADGVELRVHPTGTAVLRISVQTQGQGHETTFAQIVAEELGLWAGKGAPASGKTIAEIAWAAHSNLELPDGVEGQLDATCVYNPPNLTYPFGAYICVVDVDPGTGKVDVRRFIAVDDCGVRINPMIVEGQVHGGLADGIGMALMESIAFDADGNCLAGSFVD